MSAIQQQSNRLPTSTRNSPACGYLVGPTGKPISRALIEIDNPDYLPSNVEQVARIADRLARIEELLDGRDIPSDSIVELEAVARRSTMANETAAKFERLKSLWLEETAFCATLLEMATHPAYQQIIGMGRTVIPHILRDLSARPEHWFWALKAITGEDPVKPAHRGILDRMTRDWLLWGVRNGYDYD
jgi:hypothetical protein